MIRAFLAFLILSTGVIALGRLHQRADKAQVSTWQHRAEWTAATNRLVELNGTKTDLQRELKAKKASLKQASTPAAVSPHFLDLLQARTIRKWPKPVLAELREHLGISWESSAKYVLVSKESYRLIRLNGIDSEGKLNPNVCAVLAITPTESAGLEATIQRIEAEYTASLKTNVLRIEPAGDILAQYTIPANHKLAQRLEKEYSESMEAAIGAERAALLGDYSDQYWFYERGTLGQKDFTFTIRRDRSNSQRLLLYQYEGPPDAQGSGGVSVIVSVADDFPELLRPFFPGGWREVAEREGFELPKEFLEQNQAP
jgi:hypothetical protein